MKLRHSTFVSVLVLGVVALAIPARAASIAFTIEVEVDSGSGFVSQGTAIAGGDILDVFALPGDTVRFTVGLATAASGDIRTYTTNVTVDDPTEIDYIPLSGVELTGLNFAALQDPDTQFRDIDPETGLVASNFLSVEGANTPFYLVEYVVQAGINTDAGVDFAVEGTFVVDGEADVSAGGTAQVRLMNSNPPPEPLSDDDEDGEVNATDMCPNTFEAAEVDQAGCSQDQFCSNIDASTVLGRRTCRRSDWKNDEPLRVNPADCMLEGTGCVLNFD